ncbi:cell surface protein [Bacteroides caecigallinarum]|nr:cell surface protein [Bacteroides caecigallinarum]
MRKKYLSALLFGALLVTSAGTFTSCKDYDDEINGLQEQIDKLATKEDMEAKLSQMQAAIDAAKATAEDALAKAEAAGDTEEIESLKARIQALEDAAIDVEALKNEISTAVDSQLSTFRTEIEKLLAEMEEKLGLTVADMVTSVELIVTKTDVLSYSYPEVTLTTVTEKENVFGKDLANAITFVKDKQVQVGDDFVVRVSPANAVLTPEMISFVNSKGENLDEFVKVTKVEKYDELLSRSSNNTGLWKVTTELVKLDDNFDKVTKTEDGTQKVLFAVRVNNTPDAAENREVVSTYDLTFAKGIYTSANELKYTVDGKNVDDIRNRYDAAEDGTKAEVTEYVWNGGAATSINKDKTNVVPGDDRCDNAVGDKFNNSTAANKLLPVQQGVPFKIKVEQNESKSVRAIYVVRDDANAVESAPSELNAWKSYSYEGLNTVVEGTETTITINAEQAISDIIGFRVYAVNYDGTLVDPDGKAFYVVVGKEATQNTANLTVAPSVYAWNRADAPLFQIESAEGKYFESDVQEFSTANWANVTNIKPEVYLSDGKTLAPEVLGDIYLSSDELSEINVNAIIGSKNITKYTKVQIKHIDVRKLVDGQKYIFRLTLTDKNGGLIETCDINLTKTMPDFPTTVVPFTNVLVNNVLVVYPKTVVDANVKYDLDNVWHGVDKHTMFTETGVEAGKETVTYIPTTEDPEESTTDNVPALQAPKALLNPSADNKNYKKEYPMENSYTYGFISYDKLEGKDTYTNNEWIKKGQEFKVRFGNYVDDCTYAWKDNSAPTLAYPGVAKQESFIKLDNIVITDWYNRPAYLTPSTNILNGYAADVKVELLTGADFSKVNEYYDADVKESHKVGVDDKDQDVMAPVILLTSKVNASQGEDVPTKIRLTITDIYGFKTVKIFDPFTMTFKK